MYEKDSVVCDFWRSEFCCGTCDESYCCADPQKKFTIRAQSHCHFDAVSIAVSASIIGLVGFIILFLICWVCPRCYLYKRFRSPRRKSMFVRQSGRMFLERHFSVVSTFDSSLNCDYDSYSPKFFFAGFCFPAGLFPAPVSQAAYDGGQIMYPLQAPVQPALPTDYSPQAPNNPAYVESPKTTAKPAY
uniref:Shisa N-terminal domain-containing protein n=1 Tax=Cyprinus carpio TaxID=7962 RepID=A0A8C1Y945_CYPCA